MLLGYTNTNDILSFLLEADGEEVNNVKNSDSNDVTDKDALKQDTKDIKSSSDKDEDTEEKEDDDTIDADDVPTIDSDDSPNDEEDDNTSSDSENGNDNDNTTSPPHEEDNSNNNEKLLIFTSLKEIRNSFIGTLSVSNIIFNTSLPEENIETFKNIKKKIQTNISLLDDILNNTDTLKNKSVAELKLLHRLYIADLKMIESVLKSNNINNKL